jgi:ABC-type glycerol-3-phosphate transport system permease component
MRQATAAVSLARTLLYLLVILVGLLYLFPFVWMILSSFKLNKDVLAIPIRFLPPTWNFRSYYNAFHYSDYDFPRYIFNSVLVAVFAVLLTVILSTSSGYGFAKYKFRGNVLLFTVVLSTLMIPFEAIIVPLFILVRHLGMQDSYLGLIVPEGLTAFGVFLMRQFIYSVPDELIESARIDGASEFVIFGRIVVPLVKTAILALVIFHVQWVWNLLLWPLVVISTPELRTLPQAIALFTGVYFTPYPEQLAISVVACLPLVLLYLLLSRNFVQGIALTGLKR